MAGDGWRTGEMLPSAMRLRMVFLLADTSAAASATL